MRALARDGNSARHVGPARRRRCRRPGRGGAAHRRACSRSRTSTSRRSARRRFKVALDCVRGAGAAIMPALLEALGCEVVAINLEPDGRFPREPEPRRREPRRARGARARERGRRRVRGRSGRGPPARSSSDDGRAIGEDYTLALAARVWCCGTGAGPVVTNLSTQPDGGGRGARGRGRGRSARPVGEVNVAVRMRDEGAPIGGRGERRGDPSRGAPRARRAGRRGPAPAIAGRGGTAAVGIVARSLPRYVIVKDKLDRPDARSTRCTSALAVGVSRRGGRIRRTGCGCRGRTGGCTCGRRERSRSCASSPRRRTEAQARELVGARASRSTRWRAVRRLDPSRGTSPCAESSDTSARRVPRRC